MYTTRVAGEREKKLFAWSELLKYPQLNKKLLDLLRVNSFDRRWMELSKFDSNSDLQEIRFVQKDKPYDDSYFNGKKHSQIVMIKLTYPANKIDITIEKKVEFILPTKVKCDNLHVYTHTTNKTIGSIIAIYRNLRENFEYRLRYDEAGEFFIREMELKRKYRDDRNNSKFKDASVIRANNIILRNISLIGLYHLLSEYGHDIVRPVALGTVVIILSIAFWSGMYNPFLHQFSFNNATVLNIGNATERSITTFIQLKGEQLVWQDYIESTWHTYLRFIGNTS